MQDIIKRIIEMDEEARRVKANAEQEKVEAQKKIADEKQRIHNEYIEKARSRSVKNNDIEQKAAEEQWSKTQEKHDRARQILKKEFAEKHDIWVNSIVENVLNQI